MLREQLRAREEELEALKEAQDEANKNRVNYINDVVNSGNITEKVFEDVKKVSKGHRERLILSFWKLWMRVVGEEKVFTCDGDDKDQLWDKVIFYIERIVKAKVHGVKLSDSELKELLTKEDD